MATKNEPGVYDCYKNLEPDEPYFLLKSTDVIAPYMVKAWIAIRAGDILEAIKCVVEAMEHWEGSGKENRPYDHPKAIEAFKCYRDMRQWYGERKETQAQREE